MVCDIMVRPMGEKNIFYIFFERMMIFTVDCTSTSDLQSSSKVCSPLTLWWKQNALNVSKYDAKSRFILYFNRSWGLNTYSTFGPMSKMKNADLM